MFEKLEKDIEKINKKHQEIEEKIEAFNQLPFWKKIGKQKKMLQMVADEWEKYENEAENGTA